ncbi:hypothetical protein [Lacipirellula parvula]|uniref:Uncharacterized protein n=1 Tax=Lacipirellula parvula TaxID=2650471 RepID=A0A5K7XER7_9BACT|nr:hypothetical protein [Lacipirellula parvula]BBO33371.1 hypothetical protein PLANPX_2983 [Lacipirellula parvula]
MTDRNSGSSADEVSVLIAIEARIDTAMAHLIRKKQTVADGDSAQAAVLAELREVRAAIRILRDRQRRSR